MISTVDPDARHGHKTAARGFDGFKGHVAIDPDSEIITATTVTAGNTGDAEAAIATLDDIARVYVDFPVPEAELAGVAPGQALSGSVVAHGARRFDGRVEAVSARLDPATRAAIVRGDFANPDRVLKPGMLVQVSLSRDTRPALVVPEIAVQQVGSETFVWRVKADGTVEKVDVEVGGRIPGKVMLASGVEAGQRIVTEGVGKLQAGSQVVAGGAGPAPASAQ